ncbi:MAG: TonB-dependent receptor domain-containing protein [Pseudomonadales bacterium]
MGQARDRRAVTTSSPEPSGYNRSDDTPLAQMPPLEGRLSLAHSGERFSVGGLLRWVAEQNRVDPGRGNIVGLDLGPSPAFTVLSVNGSYRLSPALAVAAGVDNVLDANYAEHLSRSGAMVAGFVQSQRVQEPGRTLWLKLDMSL